MDDKKPIHLRLDSKVVKEVDHYAVDRDIFRNEAMEELLRRGLNQVKAAGSEDSLR